MTAHDCYDEECGSHQACPAERPVCEYRQYCDDADPCTGPVKPRDCSYERELADKDAAVKQCNCCDSCAHECYLNV